jgi:hypothetical protein
MYGTRGIALTRKSKLSKAGSIVVTCPDTNQNLGNEVTHHQDIQYLLSHGPRMP